MAEIIPFPREHQTGARKNGTRRGNRSGRTAEIIIFPGIRIERNSDEFAKAGSKGGAR